MTHGKSCLVVQRLVVGVLISRPRRVCTGDTMCVNGPLQVTDCALLKYP